MKFLIAFLVLALLVAHQDYWNWENADLWFGFLPVGLGYHIGISLAAAAVWILAVTWAWPRPFLDAPNQIKKAEGSFESGETTK